MKKTTVRALRRVIREELMRLREESDQDSVVMKLNGARELLSQGKLKVALQIIGEIAQTTQPNVQPVLKDIIDRITSQTREDAPDIDPIVSLLDKVIGMLHQ